MRRLYRLRLDRSACWAVRCVHEIQTHKASCFLTLTYSDETLPKDGDLKASDWDAFIKRTRKHFERESNTKLRFLMCGEYGEQLLRPHFHAIIFGTEFPDREPFFIRRGNPFFRSQVLERLWPHGYATIGEATYSTAAYVARYITKKNHWIRRN